MTKLKFLKLTVALGLCWLAAPSSARPTAPAAFCELYSATASCSSGVVECTQCHSTPPILNPYGKAVQAVLLDLPSYSAQTFVALLPEALAAVASLDSDNDSEINSIEISQGTQPGNADSNNVENGEEPAQWNAEYALSKVMLLFCGHSPRYEQKLAFLASDNPAELVHSALSECLASDYWQQQALYRLADKRIRPLYEIGLEGAIGIGDYNWDYRLFSYVLSNDRDARDLLLANYHVNAQGEVIDTVIPREKMVLDPTTGNLNLGSGQPLIPERRVGMISTQWFFSFFTMFAELPRNAASQAYRAYLGLDIAKSEGLMPVPGEPRDVDNKGVDAPECAVCHSTLDPLAYAFSAYAGIEETPSDPLFTGNPYGTYYPEGTEWEADSFLFGERVTDLNDWAQKAANSDAFKKNIAHMFFTYANTSAPGPKDLAEFNALWQSMPDDNYSANKLIHRLVDTVAFGGKQ